MVDRFNVQVGATGIWQRDLLGCSMTQVNKLALKLAQILPAWILGGLTPVCQLTDTDIAFILKAFARQEKEKIVSEKKMAAKRAGEEMSLECKPYEIMRIANAAHDGVLKRNTDQQIVLKGLRRNGQLGYRPDLDQQKLVKVEMKEKTWSDGMKEGSHRYPDQFLQDRYDWLDSTGRPIPVDWRRADPSNTEVKVPKIPGAVPKKFHVPGLLKDKGEVEEVPDEKIKQPSADDFARLQYSWKDGEMMIKQEFKFAGQVLEMPVLELDFEGGQEICSEEIRKLIRETPKERRLKKELNPEMVKHALKRRGGRIGNRFMIKRALAHFSPELYAGLQLDLKKMTRQEVMRRLRPVGVDAKKNKERRKADKQIKKKTVNLKKVARYEKQYSYLWLGRLICCPPQLGSQLRFWVPFFFF